MEMKCDAMQWNEMNAAFLNVARIKWMQLVFDSYAK